MEHRVHVDRAVIAHIFAERPFRLDIAALVEIALERHLGVGRNQDIVGQAFHHRRRLGAEAGDQRQLVAAAGRVVAAKKSSGWAPTVNVTGSFSPRATAAV